MTQALVVERRWLCVLTHWQSLDYQSVAHLRFGEWGNSSFPHCLILESSNPDWWFLRPSLVWLLLLVIFLGNRFDGAGTLVNPSSCPKSKIRFRSPFTTSHDKLAKGFFVLGRKFVSAVAWFITKSSDEKLHTNWFAVMGSGTLALIFVKDFCKIFATFCSPGRMVLVIVWNYY